MSIHPSVHSSTFPGADRPEIPIHPHVYSNGVICLDLLSNGNGWSPVQSVESVCMSIQSMLTGNTKNGTRPHPPSRLSPRGSPTNAKQSAPKATPSSSSLPAAPRGISGSCMTIRLSELGIPFFFSFFIYFLYGPLLLLHRISLREGSAFFFPFLFLLSLSHACVCFVFLAGKIFSWYGLGSFSGKLHARNPWGYNFCYCDRRGCRFVVVRSGFGSGIMIRLA